MKEKKAYVKATSDIYVGERRREKGDRKVGQKVCKFEDLDVWKEGVSLVSKIYRVLKASVRLKITSGIMNSPIFSII